MKSCDVSDPAKRVRPTESLFLHYIIYSLILISLVLNYHLHHIDSLGVSKNISYSSLSLKFLAALSIWLPFLYSLSNFVVVALFF